MRKFIIAEKQLNFIGSKLLKMPYESVYEVIRLLEHLPLHEETKPESEKTE